MKENTTIFKLSNVLIKKLDYYLVRQEYRHVRLIVSQLREGLSPQLGEKTEDGKYNIEHFYLDSVTLNSLLDFLHTRPMIEVQGFVEELKDLETTTREKILENSFEKENEESSV